MHKTTLRATTITSIEELQEFYWKKSELVTFCRKNGLPTYGVKTEIISRIQYFLKTGNVKPSKVSNTSNKANCRDSASELTVDTLVVNYFNDSKTREFFIQKIGAKFKFNSYLRQFTKKENIEPGLTYGDLVAGWRTYEEKHKSSDKEIPKQFEYNRFIKDYFKEQTNGTLDQAIKAWKYTKMRKGTNTYKQYLIYVNEL